LQKISKAEAEWLIKNGYLKIRYGRYSELTVTSKQRPKKKTRYVPDYLANIVKSKNIVQDKILPKG